MVGVQDEQQVKCPDHRRIECIRLGGEAERHPQEVLDQVQRVVGVEERLADRFLVGVRGDGGQFGQQPNGREVDLLVVERVERILVERRQRRYRR